MSRVLKVLSISLAVAISLQADMANSNRVMVDLGANLNKFDKDSYLSKKNSWFYDLRATIYDSVVDKYGFMLSYSGAFGVDYRANIQKQKDSDVHRLLANMVIDGEEDLYITPYIYGGAGYEYLSDEIKSDKSQGIADLGIGFRYYLGSGFYSALEGYGIYKFDTKDQDYGVGLILGYNFLKKSSDSSRFKQINMNLNKTRKIDVVKVKRDTDPRTIINEVTVENKKEAQELIKQENLKEVIIKNDSKSVQSSEINEVVDSDYFVQVAAYSSSKTYPTVRNIKKLGFDNVDVIDQESRIGTLHKVVVGPYATKDEAKEALKKLKRVNRKSYIIKG